LEVEKALIKELETIWEERFGEELETSESENEE
jgi:hypothetical protein